MKEGIHPNYQQTTIKCACGNVIETGSTKKDIRVEVCSKCHPFFTGKQKLVDTGGRVAKFNKRFGLDKYKRHITSQDPYRLVRVLFIYICRGIRYTIPKYRQEGTIWNERPLNRTRSRGGIMRC